jgi:hypothetical protein
VHVLLKGNRKSIDITTSLLLNAQRRHHALHQLGFFISYCF